MLLIGVVFHYEKSLPAGKLASSFAGECAAVLHAIQWIKERQKVSIERYVIATDCLSLITAISDQYRFVVSTNIN